MRTAGQNVSGARRDRVMLNLLLALVVSFVAADDRCPDMGVKPVDGTFRTTNIVNCSTGGLVLRSGNFAIEPPTSEKWCPLETIITPPYLDPTPKVGFLIKNPTLVSARLIIRTCMTDSPFGIIPIKSYCSFVREMSLGFRES